MKREIKKTLNFLDLDEKEYKIIEAIKTAGSLRPVNIARKTGIKRTTVNFLLKKLQLRGILIKNKVKNHYEWMMSDDSQIKNRIENLYNFLSTTPLEGIINLPKDIGIEIFKGKKGILEVYENILKTASHKRLSLIQGNKSVRMALKDLPKSYITYLQERYRKHKIILDGIVGENTLDYIKVLKPEDLKIYENRLVVTHVINDNFIDFDMDILVSERMVSLINYRKNLAVVIKNEDICEAISKMMESMKVISRKINLNKLIKELIENKQFSSPIIV